MAKNSVQKNKHDYKRETSTPKVLATMVAVNSTVSYDFIKLEFDLSKHSKEARFYINRKAFMRLPKGVFKVRADETEDSRATKYDEVTEASEKRFSDISSVKLELDRIRNHVIGKKPLDPFRLYKLIYPNCILFHNFIPTELGNILIWIYNAKLYIQFSGKINASDHSLGYINIDTIYDVLIALCTTKDRLIDFDPDVFMKYARVLRCDVVADIRTTSPNTLIKALSSYLPLRTDKHAVIGFQNGYEVIQRGKKNEYELAIYHKGKEITKKGSRKYKETIGLTGEELAQNIVRLELRLFKFVAQRFFLSNSDIDPDNDPKTIENVHHKGNLTLIEALTTTARPIEKVLSKVGINKKTLKRSRGKYIVAPNEPKDMKQAEYLKMLGYLYLLENNDYDFDKVRSHIEVELDKSISTNVLDDMRVHLQDYIACFKPRTVLTLQRLLDILEY